MERNAEAEALDDLAGAQEALHRFEGWRDGLAWSSGLPRHLWQELERAAERVVAVLDEIAAEASGRCSADERDEREERA